MSGQVASNRLKVTRHAEPTTAWPQPLHRVTFVIERRDSLGLRERRQVTFSEREVVKALRAAGFTIITPEDLR